MNQYRDIRYDTIRYIVPSLQTSVLLWQHITNYIPSDQPEARLS